jgi:AAA15 family ATPase/GTPase
MLIRFTVENFLSFGDRQRFSMIPGKGTLKSHHKSTPVKGVSALKAAIIYGANASGKSNLIKALDFGKKLILNGTKVDQLISTDFFKLDKEISVKPAYFDFEIQHRGRNYAYGFIFDNKEIKEEWLFEISKNGETKIFERKQVTIFDLEKLLKKNSSKSEHQFLDFVSKSTPRNQLFLTQIRNTNVLDNLSDISPLNDVIDWFQNALTIVYPNSKNVGKTFEILKNQDLKQIFDNFLAYCDTGIDGVEFENIDLNKLDIPPQIIEDVKSQLLNKNSEKSIAFFSNPSQDKYFIITVVEENELEAKILKSQHKVEGGDYVLFDIKDESDGTRRIMDFIPLIVDYLKGGNVFVVDEIERSLHPNLVRDIFDFILENCNNINSQLIATSHEATLLTQKLIRKDEVWFTVKTKKGITKLHSLEEYSVRFDKDIMKDYLLGRYKGVPKIGDRSIITHLVLGN